jgi:hypothetical protein
MSNLLRALRAQRPVAESLGFHQEGLTKNGHIKWRHRTGVLVITCSNISSSQRLANALAELRKVARRIETQT